MRVEIRAVAELFEQCRALFRHVRELLQGLRIVGEQQRRGLDDEVASGCGIPCYQTLIFGGKGDGGRAPDEISHILRFSAVDARSVSTPCHDGRLVGVLRFTVFHVGSDGGRRAPFFD